MTSGPSAIRTAAVSPLVRSLRPLVLRSSYHRELTRCIRTASCRAGSRTSNSLAASDAITMSVEERNHFEEYTSRPCLAYVVDAVGDVSCMCHRQCAPQGTPAYVRREGERSESATRASASLRRLSASARVLMMTSQSTVYGHGRG